MAIKESTAARNAKLNTLTTSIGGSALLNIYSGSRPANVGTAIGAQVLLVTLTCNATFAPAASAGVLTANAITNGTAGASGTASFFRLTTSGATAVIDGDVGTSGSDLNLNNTSINSGQVVSVSSFTITDGNG